MVMKKLSFYGTTLALVGLLCLGWHFLNPSREEIKETIKQPKKQMIVQKEANRPMVKVVEQKAAEIKPLWPVHGKIIADYGWRKKVSKGMEEWTYVPEVELLTSKDSTVQAALPGVVEVIKKEETGTYLVQLAHEQGIHTLYRNCTALAVQKGDLVQHAQVLGRVKDRLGFAVYRGKEPIDPREYLRDL